MADPKMIPRQALPDAPRHRDGRPLGTKCRPGCRPPADGSNHSHCSVCHNTVRTIGDWDRHRQDGYCLDLAALGLALRDGLWATPEGHAAGERARVMLAARRTS